ncbi:MAG: VOC family protein [Dehalococcoidia bacterium]
MEATNLVVLIGSSQPDRLRVFYRDILGLEPKDDFAPGAFAIPPGVLPCLLIEQHDEVAKVAKEPQRMLLSFFVHSVAQEQERLISHGVPFIRTAYEEPGVGTFATFADSDGNYCQLVELAT